MRARMMRALLCVLLAAAHVLADDSENRRSKLPYVADAVGNTLPPPSGGPATVGSPVNLLTPDRYEFYTFDESGELVKRLMTLEEIQAIVAAGEETEGLVTFANENQPTIAFNFSQPPYTKVHNVVTNVQNVLKAQMEAHKNRPLTQPTLDTPDVSDSWSLILPSIFGNTGVDIVPDKISGTFTTPETETIDFDRPIDDNSLSKEGSHQIISTSSTKANEELKEVSVTEKLSTTYSTTEKQNSISTSTTTPMPKSASVKPLSTTTAAKSTTNPAKVTTSTLKPTTTSSKPIKQRTTTTTTTTFSSPQTSTSKPRTTTTLKQTTHTKHQNQVASTTSKPTTTTTTTVKPNITTKKTLTTHKETEPNFTKIQTFTTAANKNTVQYEKLSTFVPISTAAFVTEKATQKTIRTTVSPVVTSTTKRYLPSSTKSPTTDKVQPSITTYKPSNKITTVSTTPKNKIENVNATTITTQSVSITSTEFASTVNQHPTEKNSKPSDDKSNNMKQEEPEINLFDVAQSFSQIASDLGGDYQPIPTTSDLLDTTKVNDINLESKENLEIEIPTEVENSDQKKVSTTTETHLDVKEIANIKESVDKTTQNPLYTQKNEETKNLTKLDSSKVVNKKQELDDSNRDNFVKISTLIPHKKDQNNLTEDFIYTTKSKTTTSKDELTTISVVTSTIDPVLSESMEDLFSQVVNAAPQSIIEMNKNSTNLNTNFTADIPFNIMKVKDDKPQKNKIASGTSNLNSTDADAKNMTNDIPQINLKVNKPHEQNKIYEVKTNDNKLQLAVANKQSPVKVSDSDNKKEKYESTSQMTILDQDLYINNTNKSPEVKKDNKPDGYKNKKDEVIKVTTTTAASLKAELKEPINFVTKPENISPNINKITYMEQNKIANIKDNEKNAEEPQLPKLDEFKKKIQKVNIDDKELVNERNNSWKLISTVSPPKANEISKDKLKTDSQENTDKDIVLDVSKENQGLEVTTKDLGEDIAQFTELCNELAFRYWQAMTESIEKRRSFILSPYSITSMLAMMFMGARGATSGEMNEILKLDDMVTFNPHFTLKNISDSIETTPSSGVIVSAFVRELFSDRTKGKILTFYKERAQHFYNGHVEEINFKLISDIIRRRTNLLVKRYTWGRIAEYMKSNTITMQPPLAAFSANIFQTDCTGSSVEGRDGEMYFVVSPNVRQRRLVPVPAVVYRSGFLAGYDPALDATAAALGNINSVISTLFLMPGQQGNVVHAEDLEALETRLLDSNPTTPTWNKLLRTLLPRIGLELQIPRFSHKSIFNVSTTLQKMGLKELFDRENADLGGLNGPSKDLYLSDMVQSTTFVTCGEDVIGEQHHIEEYPESLNGPQRRRTSRWTNGWDEPRDYQRAFHDPHDVGEAMNLPLHLRPRQARLPSRNAQPARLKFDRPFLYFVRHNPSGMILYVGRYNPRLLP